ncbi:MAG: DMT family transporter [Albidovulum sp.]
MRGGGLHGAPLRGHLAMALFSMLVAGSFPLGAMMANAVSPVAFTALRFLLSGVIIGAAALLTTGLPRLAARAPWRYAVLGSLFAAYFVLMFEGLKTAAPVSAAAVFTLTPVLSAGFGFLLLRQVTTSRIALALAIGAAGALWIIFRADWQAMFGFRVGRGEAVYFAGCVAHALYTPMVRKLNRGEHPLVFTFGMIVAGTAVTTLWGWGAIRATDWTALPGIVWVTLLYTSVFASAVTFVLLQYATLRLPASKVMAYTYLVPAWVILWEVALGQPSPPALVMAGVALTVLALALLMKEERTG